MKRKASEIMRVQNLLEGDRLSGGKEFEEALLFDLTTLLKDYFDIRENIELKIEKENKIYKISIGFNAITIKNFGVLNKLNNN
ncbi:MAG: hypothetical protein E7347_03060 [Clostridiales bacterium]|nr:hypothetical protein [Clostridiales bacterium]